MLLGNLGESTEDSWYDPATVSQNESQTYAIEQMVANGWTYDDAYNYMYGGTSDAGTQTVFTPTGANPGGGGTDWLSKLLTSITSGGRYGGANITYVPTSGTPGTITQSAVSKYMPLILIGGIAAFALSQ
jgi:hypothetical protein